MTMMNTTNPYGDIASQATQRAVAEALDEALPETWHFASVKAGDILTYSNINHFTPFQKGDCDLKLTIGYVKSVIETLFDIDNDSLSP